MAVIVGGAGECAVAEFDVPAFGPDIDAVRRHAVVAAGHQSGNTFGNDERLAGEPVGNGIKVAVMVVVADDVECA